MITIQEAPSQVCEKVLFEGCQSVEICNLLPQIAHVSHTCVFTPKGALRKLPAFVHKLNKKRAEVCEKITVHCHLLVTATSHFLTQSPLHHPVPSPCQGASHTSLGTIPILQKKIDAQSAVTLIIKCTQFYIYIHCPNKCTQKRRCTHTRRFFY